MSSNHDDLDDIHITGTPSDTGFFLFWAVIMAAFVIGFALLIGRAAFA